MRVYEDSVDHVADFREAAQQVFTAPLLWRWAFISLLFLSLSWTGCAHGSDGVRQACASTNESLSVGYQAFTTWYRLDQQTIRDLAKTDLFAAKRRLEAHEPIALKVLSALDVARHATGAFCTPAVFDAVEHGARDRAALLRDLAAVAVDVATATAAIAAEVTR